MRANAEARKVAYEKAADDAAILAAKQAKDAIWQAEQAMIKAENERLRILSCEIKAKEAEEALLAYLDAEDGSAINKKVNNKKKKKIPTYDFVNKKKIIEVENTFGLNEKDSDDKIAIETQKQSDADAATKKGTYTYMHLHVLLNFCVYLFVHIHVYILISIYVLINICISIKIKLYINIYSNC